MRRDLERLHDVLDAIAQIEKRTADGREEFDRDETVRVWVVYHLQVAGEAARSLSRDLQARHPEIEWSQLIGMRHILVHHYFGLNWDEVWATVENNLPTLKQQIAAMALELEDEP